MLVNLMTDEIVTQHLNYNEDKDKLPKRRYFYCLLGTPQPDYINNFIKHDSGQQN
jgi:hypothetical protein